MKHGLILYGSIVRRLEVKPATAREVAARHHLCEDASRYLLRQLLQAELLRVAGWERVGRAGVSDRVFGVGPEPSVQPPRTKHGAPGRGPVSYRRRIQPAVLSFITAWQALKEGGTAIDVAEETGIGPQAIYRFIAAMRKIRAVRVLDWEQHNCVLTAVYQLGSAPDKKRPPREAVGTVQRRARQKRRARDMTLQICGAVAMNSTPYLIAQGARTST